MVDRPAAPQYRWHTIAYQRTVLVAVHTLTSLLRLEDILPLLEADARIQLVYTQVPDELGDGVSQRLRDLQVKVLPWAEARRGIFDLVIAASQHRLEDIPARRRLASPHGAGYNKLWPADLLTDEDGTRPVYGLDRQSLLHNGEPTVDALLLPHQDHLATLSRQCPEAVSRAVVAGDPCFDRTLACREQRERYRHELGVRSSQVLVSVASTWGQESLLAQHREVLLRLPAELPASHRVIATAHPAVWAEHSARQLRSWLRDVRDAGVDLVDAGEDWRGLIAATDVLIADYSSLAVYAAAVRIPVLLSHFPVTEIDPNSVMAALAEVSPQLMPGIPLSNQLMAAREAQQRQWQVAHDRVTSRPGESASIIRKTLYELLELSEPLGLAGWPALRTPRLVQDEPHPWMPV
ncbi:MAG TPA: CDP-glycerol glycerophosphotransferase family protein [Pseudonocardiaceae bacterium]|nr:CDP-glycerol glycerophosphotransferase family protein [Pseudonocardiaceae bacterium]